MLQITLRFSLFVLLIGSLFVLRWPTLFEGKPFFYHEDEAHHFNRTVDMVKRGSLNPEYFHKPSLHFYLRMPMVLTGMWLSGKDISSDSLKEIRTKDTYGLARYSFSWSHPRVVYAVRAVSLALTMLTIILTYIVARQLQISVLASFYALVATALSPELFTYSSYIGVDVPLVFFCLLATSIAIYARPSLSIPRVWMVGVVAGLAVSCKYNGLPIALLPLALVVLSGNRKNLTYLTSALISPAIGFFLGSPYILLSFPLFVKHLSYELWHYAVAGHEGHSADPGIAQIVHYSKWLISDGIGATTSVLAAFGTILFIRKNKTQTVIFLSFPILFAALMCAQKTNFVRNMLPIIPYCAILAAFALDRALLRISFPQPFRTLLALPLIILSILPPLERTLELRASMLSLHDSRTDLESWIIKNQGDSDIAIIGALQPHYDLKIRPGITAVPASESLAQLFQSGFDFVVAPENSLPESTLLPFLRTEKILTRGGNALPMRIIENPALSVYRLSPILADITKTTTPLPRVDLSQNPTESEPYHWITQRISQIKLPALQKGQSSLKLTVELMSPWQNQELTLLGNNFSQTILLNLKDPGQWQRAEFVMPEQAMLGDNSLWCVVRRVTSPASWYTSGDTRRLGVAIRLP